VTLRNFDDDEEVTQPVEELSLTEALAFGQEGRNFPTGRQFYGGGRQCGKTTKMLAWMKALSDLAAEDNTQPIPVMVCHSSQRAMQVYRSTFDDDDNPTWAVSWQFLGPDEIRGSNPHHRNRIVYGIEDVDLWLSRLVGGGPVQAWSATTEYDRG
jgi:hypothetical protein